MQKLHGLASNERGLLGGFRKHSVAGGQGGGDLSGIDRQREVPRRDADEDAPAVKGHLVLFASWTRESHRT